jgi:hypothetical protein
MVDVPMSPERWVTVAGINAVADAVGMSPDRCVTVAGMKLVALAVGMRPGAVIFGPLARLVVVAVAVPDAGPTARYGPTEMFPVGVRGSLFRGSLVPTT